jgi:4-amino-4-deoxy-L-arabinose transferase-like glycosyltransferase
MSLQLPKAFSIRFWQVFAVLVVAVLSIAALFWILDQPFGSNWDEARLMNSARQDAAAFWNDGILGLARSIMGSDRSRPPAARIMVLPITLPFGVTSATLRIISLVSLWGSLFLTYLAASTIAGAMAGAFATIFLIACPIVIAPNMRYYVDFPLYLSIALLMYFLLRDWQREQPSRYGWVGLGIALGLGAWAKPPILFVAAPTLFMTLLFSQFRLIAGHNLRSLLKATGLALVIMAPWWVLNFGPTVQKAFRSGGFVRHALGEKGQLITMLRWFNVFIQTMLGPALTLLMLAIVVTLIVQLVRKQLRLDVKQVSAIVLCLAGALPMLAVSFIGTNHNVRLIAPALLPLAIAIGIVAVWTHWTTSRWLVVAATALICFQVAIMVSPSGNDGRYQVGDAAARELLWGNPTNAMRRTEQWDWLPVKQLLDDRSIKNPLISYLGSNAGLEKPHIARPWIWANEPVRITTMWTYLKGDLDWNQIMSFAAASDVVVTAPNLTGSPIASTPFDRTDLDNQHNAELVDRLKADPRFAEPIVMTMGRYNPTQVYFFLQKPGQTPAPVPSNMRTHPYD